MVPSMVDKVDLTAIIEAVVEAAGQMRALRLERAALMARYQAGTASESDRRRYRTVRLALLLRESSIRQVRLPRSADEVFARRSALLVEALVGSEVPAA